MSRCSESFLENAPDARWGVALADRHCLESPSFIRPTCRMLDAYQFMPHLRIPRVGGASFSLPFSPPFSYSRRLVDVRRGISFRYHVCSYDSRCNVPATQVNRFCRFSEWNNFFEEVKFLQCFRNMQILRIKLLIVQNFFLILIDIKNWRYVTDGCNSLYA